jgi:hypothetical protein
MVKIHELMLSLNGFSFKILVAVHVDDFEPLFPVQGMWRISEDYV